MQTALLQCWRIRRLWKFDEWNCRHIFGWLFLSCCVTSLNLASMRAVRPLSKLCHSSRTCSLLYCLPDVECITVRSETRRKGSSASSISSTVVGEESMRPVGDVPWLGPPPVPCNRQHQSQNCHYCLEVKRENNQNCSVLCMPRVGPEYPLSCLFSFLVHLFPQILLFFTFFPFLLCRTYFFLLSIPSLFTRIVTTPFPGWRS